MKNYYNYIYQWWNDYSNIEDHQIDDSFFYEKYNKLGITTRKEWYILKNKKPKVIDRFCENKTKHDKEIEILYKEKGISVINGCLTKTPKGKGPSNMHKPKTGGNSDIIETNKKLELCDVFSFNYDDMLDCKPDDNKEWINHINNISFERKDRMYGMYKEIYMKYERQYVEDKNNGNFEKIKDIILRLGTYFTVNELNAEDNFSDGGIICNIGIIISEYIKTGVINTNIDRFKYYSIAELNEFYNTYIVFILLNVITCKYYKYKMTVNDVVEREKWYVNMFRRRKTNRPMKTTCVIPSYQKDINGNIILYCDTYEKP